MRIQKTCFRPVLKSMAVILAGMSILAGSTAVFAQPREVSVTSIGEMGAVDIALVDDWEQMPEKVLPGQVIDLKSHVVNKAEPAWIRVHMTFDADDNDASSLLTDQEVVLGDRAWKKIGDYYYYPKALRHGQTVRFSDLLTIPVSWDNETSGHACEVALTAEAIQEKHFTPDFQSSDPWHGAVIQSFQTDHYKLKQLGNTQFQIICEDGSEELIQVGDDFFSNWEHMMPGDTLQGTLTISNQMKVPVRMYFHTDTRSPYGPLLEQLTIQIKNGSNIVYDGPMNGDVDPEVCLQEYEAGSSSVMEYTIHIPAELDNAYALKDLEAVWTFRAEIPGVERETTIQPTATNVKTGDISVGIYVAALAIGFVLIATVAVYKRKENVI